MGTHNSHTGILGQTQTIAIEASKGVQESTKRGPRIYVNGSKNLHKQVRYVNRSEYVNGFENLPKQV